MAKTGDTNFLIALLAQDVRLIASTTGLEISYVGSDGTIDLSKRSDWRKLGSITSQGQLLAQSVEFLVQEELLTKDVRGLYLDYQALKDLSEIGVDFIEHLVPWAPFSIHVRGSGVIGTGG
ncbi:MAG: hypothetical protein ACKOA8_19585, partial [Deltaproteobacteria bacterium]